MRVIGNQVAGSFRWAVAAIVFGLLLGGFGRSAAIAGDEYLRAQATGPWTITPETAISLGGHSEVASSGSIPVPDLAACDNCDYSGVPVYGEQRTPRFGARLHDWWSQHMRTKRRNCYYGRQDFHRNFFNPVLHPSGPTYGFHVTSWSPFPGCYVPPPSAYGTTW